ncbi:MAG: Tex family protein [Peptococcaceae bacterium]|nr:Tex family protein [Peptococcaceae bacterium]
MTIEERLEKEFAMPVKRVEKTIALLDDGATVPFIARYRKDETGGLDDQVLRAFADALEGYRRIESRRADVLRLIDEQGKLTDALAAKIAAATQMTELEDLYRPYRPKRKTRASIAEARGLAPLAEAWLAGADGASLSAQAAALADASDELETVEAAIDGACDILAERLADDADIRAQLRDAMAKHAVLTTKAGKKPDPLYDNYLDYSELLAKMAAHRILAIGRAERDEALIVHLDTDEEAAVYVLYKHIYRKGMAWQTRLQDMCRDCYKRLLKPSLEKEVRKARTEWAEDQSTVLFQKNLRDLLLQPPVRGHVVLGFDPGFANGCKLAVIDTTGNVLETVVIHPFRKSKGSRARAEDVLRDLISRHHVSLIAIGNGTASRESERLVAELLEGQDGCGWYIVSEAGASIYSASPLAAEEFPDLDATLRSAVSIARRVQDPLAELVKIDPRSIGVGQYQHDIDQKKLTHALDGVVEDCVNHVGVDLNTASVSLLSHVAGVNNTLAKNIVAYRDANGNFASRKALLKVPKLGPKTFEQCAGFLRIPDGTEMLDNTQVHPESYDKVRDMAALFDCAPSPALAEKARAAMPVRALAEKLALGPQTLADILDALEKPGRDPREDLPQPVLRHDLLRLEDLEAGMELEGTVTNIAAFGAFVDIGLHENGLVHVSQLADRYVKDPLTVVRVGQVVNTRVLDVDRKRRRISLSMRDVKQPE